MSFKMDFYHSPPYNLKTEDCYKEVGESRFYKEIFYDNKVFGVLLLVSKTKSMYGHLKAFLMLPLVIIPFTRRFAYKSLPLFIRDAKRIYFFDRKGRRIKDISTIEKLYRTCLFWEIVYTRPPVKLNDLQLKVMEKFSKSYLDYYPKIKYDEETKDNFKLMVQDYSKELHESDYNMNQKLLRIVRTANKVFNNLDTFCHKPEANKLYYFGSEITNLISHLEDFEHVLKDRAPLWKKYESALKKYISTKFRKYKLIALLIKDVLSLLIILPFINTLTYYITRLFKGIYSSYFGYNSIVKSQKHYKNFRNDLEKFNNMIFRSQLPESVTKYN